MALTLDRARENLREVGTTLTRIDAILEGGIVQPRNDLELACVVGITVHQLSKVREYITTGQVSLDLGTCRHCGGWGRWDDTPCGDCDGSGDS